MAVSCWLLSMVNSLPQLFVGLPAYVIEVLPLRSKPLAKASCMTMFSQANTYLDSVLEFFASKSF
jgi:hypothetical protein